MARDYMAPVERLPSGREIPDGERPRFAPRGIEVFGPLFRLVRPGEGRWLRFADAASEHRGDARLGWYVTSSVVQVDRRGQGLRVAKRRQQRVGLVKLIDEQSFGFWRVPARPGLYRWTIAFRDRRGRLLGRYREHFRVVRPRLEVHLRLNRETFQPGETVRGRIENLGTERLSYGYANKIELYDGTDWIWLELRRMFPAIALSLEPGMIDDCSSNFRIPNDFAPGRYRMVQTVDQLRSKDLGYTYRPVHTERLTAEFEVAQ